jgi:hypothetical protein
MNIKAIVVICAAFLSINGIALAGSITASSCPQLTGLYWDAQYDKEMNRVFKIDQHGCESIAFTFCFINKDGSLDCGSEIQGKLDGQMACTDYGYCRAYSAISSAITTTPQGGGISTFPGHGDCKWAQYSYTQDSHGNIVETTPAVCADGFSGKLSRLIEKFR